MRKLDLNQLLHGVSGITAIFGRFLWEATVFCLTKMGHDSGVPLKIYGNRQETLELKWFGDLGIDVAKTWNDEQELTEYAATAIALLLVLVLTGYTSFKRAQKGTKGDYWLGKLDDQGILVIDALLEVSGILKESKNNRTSIRFKTKQIQVKSSPYQSVLKNIIVVEFSSPKTKVELI